MVAGNGPNTSVASRLTMYISLKYNRRIFTKTSLADLHTTVRGLNKCFSRFLETRNTFFFFTVQNNTMYGSWTCPFKKLIFYWVDAVLGLSSLGEVCSLSQALNIFGSLIHCQQIQQSVENSCISYWISIPQL